MPLLKSIHLHVFLRHCDSTRHGGPVRLHPDTAPEVGGRPALGVVDGLNAKLCGAALATHAVAEARKAPLGVRLVEGEVAGAALVATGALRSKSLQKRRIYYITKE